MHPHVWLPLHMGGRRYAVHARSIMERQYRPADNLHSQSAVNNLGRGAEPRRKSSYHSWLIFEVARLLLEGVETFELVHFGGQHFAVMTSEPRNVNL